MPKKTSTHFKTPHVAQLLPALISGGIERGTVDVNRYLMEKTGMSTVVSKGGGLVPAITAVGGAHVQLNMKSHNPITIARNFFALRQKLPLLGVNLLHARSRVPSIYGYLLSKALSLPYITTIHSAYPYQSKLKYLYNKMMIYSDHIIVPSEFMKRHLMVHYHVSLHQITVIPRGIDLSHFDPGKITKEQELLMRRKWGVAPEKRILLVPGRLTRYKGAHIALEALAQLRSAMQGDWCVLIVGGANKKKSRYQLDLEHAIQTLGLTDMVVMAGLERDMPAAYKVSDLCVTPALRPEAFGRVNAEAGAMGVPVISSGHGGALEIIKHGETGWVYAPEHPTAFFDMLHDAVTMPKEALEKVGHAARAHVVKTFPNEAMLKATYEVYQKVLERGPF